MSNERERSCTSIFRSTMRFRHILNTTATDVASNFELRGSEMAMIDTLGKYGPLTMSELAKACFFSLPNATYTVTSLEKKKLLKRERSSDSKRVVNVYLSPAGESLFKQTYPKILHEVDELLESKLTETERKIFRQLIGKLAECD